MSDLTASTENAYMNGTSIQIQLTHSGDHSEILLTEECFIQASIVAKI